MFKNFMSRKDIEIRQNFKGGVQMKYYAIMLAMLITSGFSRNTHEPTGWEYQQSTLQAFYMLEILTLDDEIPDSSDVVGAFFDGVCVGFINADPSGYTTVPLMGNDGGDYDYLNQGEVAELFIYDASNGSILPINPADNLPGWAINAIFTIDGTSTAYNTFGCTDASACNYNVDATADNGSCAVNDCFGECGGIAVEDACGVCGGDGSDDQGCGCFEPGPSGCDNQCGSDLVVDECGVCGGDEYDCADSAGACSCSGCTNSDADNHDENASINDGTCEFTVPAADDLEAVSGENRVSLTWSQSADFSECMICDYNYDVYVDGEYHSYAGSEAITIYNLIAGQEYTFYVVSQHEYGTSAPSGSVTATPLEPTGLPTWRLQLVAEIDSWDQFANTSNPQWLLQDTENYLGTSTDGTWGYDENHDIPEPTPNPGNYISLFFDHPEWDTFWGSHFTEDIVQYNDDFFSHNLTEWNGTVVSNVPGTASITLFVETGASILQASTYQMYVEIDGEYTRISDTDSTTVDFYMDGSGQKDFTVTIGNIVPQAPADLSSQGGDRSIDLSWSADDASDLSTLRGRYPATSYNVYRDGEPNDPDANLASDHIPGGCGLLTGASGQQGVTYYDNANIYGIGSCSVETSLGLGFDCECLEPAPFDSNVTYHSEASDQYWAYCVAMTKPGCFDDYCSSEFAAACGNECNDSTISEWDDNYTDHQTDIQHEGLLYESHYDYTVTSSNAAGESSEGHIVRSSGRIDDVADWNSGRDSRTNATTDDNINPDANTLWVESTNDDIDGNTVDGTYRIPHNYSPDANTIAIHVDGSTSGDEDAPYGITTFKWTYTGDELNLQDWSGDLTDNLSFNVANLHESGDNDYTFTLDVTSDYPVKDAVTCDDWSYRLDTRYDSESISITVEEEPNADPVASSALGLIRAGDGNSVVTSDDYDESDFNDYDDIAQVWYEPHDNNGDENPADLWFSADASHDDDVACESGDDQGDIPECLDDCDQDAFWAAAENQDSDGLCEAILSWGACTDDCPPEDEVEEVMLFCSECLSGESFSCSELFCFDDDCDHEGDGEGCEPCEGADGCGNYYEEEVCVSMDGCYWLGWEDGPGCGDENDDYDCDDGGEYPPEEYCESLNCDYGYHYNSITCDCHCNDEGRGDSDRPGNKVYPDLFSFSNARDDGEECDHQTYEWFVTAGTAVGFDFEDLDGDGQYSYGEPFTLGMNDELIYEDTDLGDYIASGPGTFKLEGWCESCEDGVYTAADDVDGLSPHNGDNGSYNYNGRDAHISMFGGGDDSVFILTMVVTDVYGDTDQTSLLVAVRPERNEGPTVGDLRAQDTYYISYGKDERQAAVGASDCSSDNLNAADSDNDDLEFDWSYDYADAGTGGYALDYDDDSDDSQYAHEYQGSPGLGDNGWNDISYDLAEGDHTFTFTATDSYGAQASSSTTISIRREHDSPAAGVEIKDVDLKYIEVEVSEGELDPSASDECYGRYYDGDPENTQTIELFRDGVHIETYTRDDDHNWTADNTIDSNSAGEGERRQIDKNLEAETTYTYSVQSYNSDDVPGHEGASASATTANRPTVDVLTPNGLEILSINDQFEVTFDTQDDQTQHISKIEVYYLRDGVAPDGACDPDTPAGEYGTDDSNTDDACKYDNTCDPGAQVLSNTGANELGAADGDGTTSFWISDNTGGQDGSSPEINYDTRVLVRVYDVGDYDGGNIECHQDISDSPFTMASHTLHHELDAGWHLFGPALEIYQNELLLVEHLEGSGNMGNWGQDWVAFNVAGTYDGLTLNIGEGYYLAVGEGATMEVRGNPVTGDPVDSGGDLSLKKGWNLIANPLVNKVSKQSLTINDSSGDKEFEDAVDAGWIAPTIYGWFEGGYSAIDRLLPFGGYWVNTSRDLTVKVRPHLFDDNSLTRKSEEVVATSTLELKARDISGDGVSDFITIGLLENADDEFVYGEDEYDLPRQAYNSMGGEYIDMKIGSDLMKDIKSSEYDDFQAWNISIVTEKVDNDIELSWGDVSGFEDELHIVINGEVVNMHEENYIELTSMIEEVAIVVGNVEAYLNPIPGEFGLSAAYPNPFNPSTTLGLALDVDGFVSMSVFNIRGQVVEVLVDRNMKAGYHNVAWNADGISSGMYFVRVEAGANTAMQKLMLLK